MNSLRQMDWYEVLSTEPSLHQCDLLPALPIPLLAGLPSPVDLGEEAQGPYVQPEYWGVMVLTQSCDVENRKVPRVLLARYVEWREIRASEQQTGKGYRKKLRSGAAVPQMVLPPHGGDPALDWSVVDFRQVVTLDLEYVEAHVASLQRRLRIRPERRQAYVHGFSAWISRPDYLDRLAPFDDHE